jgi:hypothetical protein
VYHQRHIYQVYQKEVHHQQIFNKRQRRQVHQKKANFEKILPVHRVVQKFLLIILKHKMSHQFYLHHLMNICLILVLPKFGKKIIYSIKKNISYLFAFRFVIELCESIRILNIEIANFELFSSVPKTFRVSASDR